MSSMYSQEKQVEGTVLDETGMGLPGCSVAVKGTNNAISTDFNGKFTIKLKTNGVLIVSYVGYVTKEVLVTNLSKIVINLQPDIAVLNDVVVVGYGSQKKSNLTGAVSQVKMDDVLGDRPVSNVGEALQGAVPGLQVSAGSGQPGSGAVLNIRGFTSINGGSPLILVDNVQVSSIDDINPKDVESVSVLKDAASASIYGARAAFGVILITTKKGSKNQKIKFNYSSNLAFTNPTDLPQKANTLQMVRALKDWEQQTYWTGQNVSKWLTLVEDYQVNPNSYPADGVYLDSNNQAYPLKDTPDLWKNMFKQGVEHIHNLSFSGGSEKSAYRVSLGLTDQDGIMTTNKDSYRRYNFNSSLVTDLTDNFTSTVNIFYNNGSRKTPSNFSQLFTTAIGFGPYVPSGFVENTTTGEMIPYKTPKNILEVEPETEIFGNEIRFYSKLDWKPIKNVTLSSEYTFNQDQNNERNVDAINYYVNPETFDTAPLDNTSRYYRSHSESRYQSLNLLAKYENSFGNHNFTALIGSNQEENKTEFFSVRRDDLLNPEVPSLSTATGEFKGTDSFGEWAISGYFSRINYNYKEKYLLELNGRYDGSSRFASKDRFALLPSASAGWVVSKESFMESLKPIVNNFKLRASYGEIGNQQTNGLYPYIPSLNSYNGEWIDQTGQRYLTLAAPSLISAGFTWERVRTLDIGVDLGMFSNRLNASFDWYNRQTLGMLDAAVELPVVLGTKAPLQNVADLETKGWELSLNWNDRIGNDFKYSLGANLYDSRSYITKIQLQSGNIYGLYEGKEITEMWGYETAGFFGVNDFKEGVIGNPNNSILTLNEGIAPFKNTNQLPGDMRFVDKNGDGEINNGNSSLEDHGDLVRVGNSAKRYQFGITGSASYKSFDLSFLLQGIGKRDRFVNSRITQPLATQFEPVYINHLDTWSESNTNAFYPRVGSRNYGVSSSAQTRYVWDASYLRVKNVTLGYNFNRELLDKLKIQSLRLFVSGENLFTFDHLPHGIDPDLASVEGGGGYPFMSKYSLGINLTF